MRIKIDFSKLPEIVNKTYEPLLNERKARYIVLMGGAGSGKSWFTAQLLAYRVAKDRPLRVAVVRKIQRTLQESVVKLMTNTNQYTGLGSLVKTTRAPHRMEYQRLGSEIIFLGIDDPEKIKSIEGIDVIWVEEATELKENDFEELDRRLRSSVHNQMIMSFNPISNRHWLRSRFFPQDVPMGEIVRLDLPAGEACVLRTNYQHNRAYQADDNPYVRKLRAMTGVGRQVYHDAEWGKREGLIYDGNFETTDWTDTYDEVVYGLDFGYTNPMALVKVGRAGEDFYVETVVYRSHTTTAELIEMMKKMNITQTVYCDSADPEAIRTLSLAGFRAKPADKSVRAGIDYLLSQRVFVHKESVELINERDEYRWDTHDKDVNQKELPVKSNDHALDATRYAIYTHWGRQGGFYVY